MSTPTLTTTSYAVLGLLAVRPWSTYELTQQMDRSLGRIWPRAQSKLYEEPKKLVTHGLATAGKELVGKRSRTVYTITAKGRRALRTWLGEPGAGPAIEFEQLLKVFFSDHGSRDDALASITAAGSWAAERARESADVGRQYADGQGPFPERRAQQLITAGFLNAFYATVVDWAAWAAGIVVEWPEDPSQAVVDEAQLARVVADAERAAAAAPTTR